MRLHFARAHRCARFGVAAGITEVLLKICAVLRPVYSCLLQTFVGGWEVGGQKEKVTIWNFACDGNSRFYSHVGSLGFLF